jgi:cobalt-zinc-cadmium efflux system membrane fusion protein
MFQHLFAMVTANARTLALAGGGGGIVVALLLTQVGWWQSSSPATAAAPPAANPDVVRIAAHQLHQLQLKAVEQCTFRQQRTAIGQIAFNEDASTNVFTPFSGRVTRLIARVGDEVKRGDPLFEIDSPEVAQAQTDLIAALLARDKAKSQLDTAQKQAERLTRLLREKAVSQRETDQALNELAAAESDFRTAEGALNAARNRLRVIIGRDEKEVERIEQERIINPLLVINAPIDGTVVARKIGPGQFVRTDATEPLYSISDLSTMWLKAHVAESDIPFVRVGQEVEVRVLALPQRPMEARIIAIGAASDPITRRIMVRSEIPNPDRILRAEMFATFKILVGAPEQAPAVPPSAVIREGELTTVWVQEEPQLFRRRSVKIGIEQNGCVQVSNGLRVGEVVVSRGAIFVDNESRR